MSPSATATTGIRSRSNTAAQAETGCDMCRLQSQMTMLTMRCRVLQNELVEGQQEQQAAQATMVCLQHALLHQKALERATTKQ
jgi:hypothetical protein